MDTIDTFDTWDGWLNIQPVLLHIGRVVYRDVLPDFTRYETWLLTFSTIPTRPGGVLCQIYDFLVRCKWLLQVMIGNRDELKGNQDQQLE